MSRRTFRAATVTLIAILVATLGLAAIGRRDGERISAEGRVSSIQRDHDGYRVQLDRGGYSYWVPERALRDRSRDFRVGVSVRFGGIFRGGVIIVDVVDWAGIDRLRGTVERIDDRAGILLLREERTGRLIRADLDGNVRHRPFDHHNLQRGDFVVLSGHWTRGGGFDVDGIESVRPRREGWRP